MIPEPHVIPALVDPVHMAALKLYVEDAYLMAAHEPREEVQKALEWGGLSLTWLRPGIDIFIEPIVEAVTQRWPEARLVDEFSVFRRITPDTYIWWHMDADGTGSWTADPLFNCWMPLEKVGYGDYPTLEVITNSEPLMRQVGIAPPGHREDEWVERNLPYQDVLTPKMSPGDALIFSHFLLHRTQPMDHLKGPRIGAEMRFTMQQPGPVSRRHHWLRKAAARIGWR